MEWICSNLKTIYCTEAEVAKMRRALEPLCKDLFHRSLNGTVMETDLPLDMIQRYLAFANEPLWNDEEVSKKTTKEPYSGIFPLFPVFQIPWYEKSRNLAQNFNGRV